jgi:thioredoxin-related protein
MTRILLAILILGMSTGISKAQESPEKIQWYTFTEAVEANLKNPKPLFIDVYTDWCSWCKKMDKTTFTEPKIAKYMNENYYPVKFDAEMKEEIVFQGTTFINPSPDNSRSTHQVAQALLKGKMSYPSYVFMTEKLEWLTVVPGYMDVDKFEPIIHYFGEKAYEGQSFEEFSKDFESKKSQTTEALEQ